MMSQPRIEQLNPSTTALLDPMAPRLIPKDAVEAYVDAFVQAAGEHPAALTAEGRVTQTDIEHARERFLCDDTIGCIDALGRIICAVSVSCAGDVAEAGNLFRVHTAPKGIGALVMAALLEHALSKRCTHVLGDVLDANVEVLKLYKAIGGEVWLQNDGFVWIHFGGRERILKAVRLLRTGGWTVGEPNDAPSNLGQLSWRHYADDHYYGF